MADYQAPLKQMRFTIQHLAEFKDVIALPDFSSVDADMVDAVLEEAGRFRLRRAGPDQLGGRPAGREGGRPRGPGAAGIHLGLPQVLRRRLAGHRLEPRIRRPGPAEDRLARLRRNVGGRQRGLRAVPGTVPGRHPRDRPPRHRRGEADLPREADLRPVDRHDVPHRAAVGLRPVDAHDEGAAGRRQPLPDHGPQDLHHVGRSRDDREHRAPGAGAPAGRAAGNEGRLAVPRAEVQARFRRRAGRAQRRVPRLGRTQARHSCEPDRGARVRRQRGRRGRPRRQAERRPRRDVHDDELHASRRGRAGRRLLGPGLPGGGDVRARPQARSRAGREGRRADHSPPRHPSHAAADAGADAGGPSHHAITRRAASIAATTARTPKAPPPGRRAPS